MTEVTRAPALFLDRDGVIIENRANYVRSWADVAPYPQALAALARLRPSPYKIILVTNQSAVGRGILSLAQATAINEQLVALVARAGGRIDDVFMCPHAPADGCHCRKPQPGLLLQAATRHNLALDRSWLIGDAVTDLEAGHRAGLAGVALLRTGRGMAQLPQATALASPYAVFDTLSAAVAAWAPWLLPAAG